MGNAVVKKAVKEIPTGLNPSVEMGFYPWHFGFRDQILKQHQKNHLAHALLFSGPEHLGKRDFALALASVLLCEQPLDAGTACLKCHHCHLLQAATHPDFKLIEPEDGATQIKIDQIRGLIHWVGQTAQLSGMKIVIIQPAQQMNIQSANALLKCLEEPSSNTLLILITSRPASLLPTIRSRCQLYPFPVPETTLVLNWLAEQGKESAQAELLLTMAGGAPLAVTRKFDNDFLASRQLILKTLADLALVQGSAVDSSAKLQKFDQEAVFSVIQEILADCIRIKAGAKPEQLKNQDMLDDVGMMTTQLNQEVLYSALDRAGQDLRALRSTSNPNKTLLLENFLIDFQQRKLGQLGDQLL